MAHTPRPWEYQNDTITSTHGDIARIHYQSSRDKKGWDDRPLIAAAPELLAACKQLHNCLSDWMEIADSDDLRNSDSEAIKLSVSAIAKAEGRSE